MELPLPAAKPAAHKWYVIRAKPHRERFVHEQLLSQGVEVFYPCVAVKPVNPRSARERAYFPGYLFVRLDLAAEGANRIRWLPAAIGLVEFGGDPAAVPEALITQLKQRIAIIQAAGGLVLAELQHGDPVEITTGPFEGYAAIFDLRLKGSDRVRVLIDMLRRQVSMEVNAGMLRKLKGGRAEKPGHGQH